VRNPKPERLEAAMSSSPPLQKISMMPAWQISLASEVVFQPEIRTDLGWMAPPEGESI
jgi:hypothetical protein